MPKQTLTDSIDRLEQMIGPQSGDTWDLSDNDQDAIRQVLTAYADVLLAAKKAKAVLKYILDGEEKVSS